MSVNLLNDNQRRRLGSHLRLLVSDLDGMIGGGLITLERARVILYRPARLERP